MAGLLAIGKLRDCNIFPTRDITAHLFRSVEDGGPLKSRLVFYRELIPALKERGRGDLAAVIEEFSRREAAPRTVL